MNKYQFTLTELLNREYITTDDWKAVEFDGLDDLGFVLDGIYSMSFEYEQLIDGSVKKLNISVAKKQQNKWVVKYKTEKMQQFEEREFDSYSNMLKFVYDMFNKN